MVELARRLRIMTLNCWNVSEPFDERMAIIRGGLEIESPDVVGFQEMIVRRDGFDQSRLVLPDGGFSRVFGAAFSWADDGTMVAPNGDGSGFGNLIASCWPIVRSEVRRLPGIEGGEPRTTTAALVESPAGLLPVLTTHLDWEFHHGYIRERQVLALDAFAREWAAEGDLPAVLLGDFNAHPDSNEIRFLRGLASLDGRSTYFRDAWDVAHGSGYTWDNRNRFAAYALEPDRRIDYVLVGPPRPDGRGRLESARLAFDMPVGDVFASDHFGVIAVLRI
jgi:endonuclease/exonuclease/phosphatase family metal-dependent hydrolase